ncbi:MAG: hypothetical protein JXA90_13520 [Planctomycetes bacterium]|nr:hypothetical protein [Planctomycetota bacterium]
MPNDTEAKMEATDDREFDSVVDALGAALLRYRSALNLARGKVAFHSPMDIEAREKARGSLYFASQDLHEVARAIEVQVAARLGREPGEMFDYDTGQVLTAADRRARQADDRPNDPWWVVAAKRAARKEG